MSNPASAPAGAYIIQGLTTIRWGTDGFLQDAALNAGTIAIVNSVKPAKRVKPIEIENNAGFTGTKILLIDGEDYDINVVDDTAKSWPVTGMKMMLQGPDDGAPKGFLVVDNDYDAAKKKEGTRTIKAQFFTAFSVN